MNILMIFDSIYPDNAGGSEVVGYETGKRLVSRGHRVYVLTRRFDSSQLPEETIQGMSVYRYPWNPNGILGRNLSIVWNSYCLYKKLAREVSFDILYFHHVLPTLGIHLSKISNQQMKVCNFYTPFHEEFLSNATSAADSIFKSVKAAIFFRLESFHLRHCQKIFVLSEYSRNELLRTYGDSSKQKVSRLSGGVDVERFSHVIDKKRIRTGLGIPSNKIVLLSVRRLVPRMGLDILVQAMKKIIEKRTDVYIIIGGRGPEREHLEGIVKNLDLDSYIHFAGYIPDDDLPQYYQSADIFILPSIELEGFGLVTLEALASGVPVLGSSVGATAEILSGLDKDLLLQAMNPADLAKAVLDLISSGKLNEEFSRKCREYALTNFSWDQTTAEIETVCRGLLRAKQT